jgi:predicted secreted protein
MANPTSNFNWQMPTPTDLVTDLPADFEVFGQAVDSSMADLLGGTTGQVLAKNSNTNMDFVWVAQDDSNAIQNAIVDAKGDLIAASANDTPARLAVGANGLSLVADSAQTTGLKWAYPNANGASIYSSGAQLIANNTFTALTAQNEFFDTDGYHSNSVNTSRITIPAGLGGKYLVQGQCNFDLNAVGGRVVGIYKNGSAFVPGGIALPSATEYVAATINTVVSLVAGDYIELFVRQTSGGNLNAYIDSASGYFSATFLGA